MQNADTNPSYFIRGETSYTDDGNYVAEQKDARGKIVRTEIDPERGTTTSVTDAKGQTVTYEYDNLRRIVKTSANVGAEEGILTAHNEYTYDAQRGNLVEIRHNTDGNAANDVVYSFEQDALGRQTAVKVGNQTLSQSAYQNDPTKPNFGTLTATTYGNGAKIRSRYDDFNRVTGVVYGEETAPRYEYDYNAKGQVARVRDNLLNRTTQSEYDLANRPVRVKTSEDAKHVYTGQVAYDNVYGNLSEFTEKVGENRQEYGTKFGYDDENRPTSLTYSVGATTIGQSTTTIDKLNRMTFSVVKLGSKTFTSEYHFAAGGYGTGSVTNLVSSITQPGCNCGYGYDDNGNIASATLNGKWTGYTYDALGQLIQVNDHSDTRSGGNGTTWKYTYDLGGNILKKERFAYADTTTPLETVTYEYGDANWRDKLTAVNGNAIAYDAIGNPLNDGTWTYTWQNGRQLQKMQKAGMTAEFVYNADGLRVQKTVNGVVTGYTLHGKNVVHMTKGNDELHFFYDAQNRPAVVVYNGTAYAYVKSLQGDIVAILDENGNAVVSYGYDAWGAPLWCTGELAETLGKVQPFRYRGYVFDEETGLYYLRSRFYNSSLCRFIDMDCLIHSGNTFAYCCNSPASMHDVCGTTGDYAYDRDKVIEYGRQYYNKQDPYYPQRSYRNNCVRFASQCLYAGLGDDIIAEVYPEWHCYRNNQRDPENPEEHDQTRSWRKTNYFYRFLMDSGLAYNTTRLYSGWDLGLMAEWFQYEPGDFLFFSNGNGADEFYHVAVVSAITENDILFMGNTTDCFDASLTAWFQDPENQEKEVVIVCIADQG